MIMVAVMALTVFHPGFCLSGLWTTIGVTLENKEEVAAVHSTSRFCGIWAMIGRSSRKRGKTDNEQELERSMANSSAQTSKENVSS